MSRVYTGITEPSRRRIWIDRSTLLRLLGAPEGTRLLAVNMVNDAGAVAAVFENDAWGPDIPGSDAPLLGYGVTNHGDGPTQVDIHWPSNGEDRAVTDPGDIGS